MVAKALTIDQKTIQSDRIRESHYSWPGNCGLNPQVAEDKKSKHDYFTSSNLAFTKKLFSHVSSLFHLFLPQRLNLYKVTNFR